MVSDAIISARNQNGYEVEIVVVDDGSIDGTADFIQDHFGDVTVIRQNNAGPGPARNAGVEASQGDVVMFLDSDDTWLPHHVKSLIDTVSSGYDVAYGTTLTKDRVQNNEFLIPEDGNGADGDCTALLSRWCFMVPSSVAVTRKAFDTIGGFGSGSLGEDWAFFVQLAEWFPFGFSGPDPITIRQLHQGSLCCLEGHEAIINAIRNVGKVAKQSKKNNGQYLHHFEQLEEWVMKNGEGWNTVQDWYCAMKKEGMV
jgi:glycosyltransferase involved in cell wall biosynthesis